MFGSKETHVVVLDDWSAVAAALQQELASAPADLRPGLERALHVLGDTRPTEASQIASWVTNILVGENVDPAKNEVAAIRALRKNVPGLGLQAATELVSAAKNHATAQSR